MNRSQFIGSDDDDVNVNVRQPIAHFHVHIPGSGEASNGILLSLLSFFPLLGPTATTRDIS